MASIIQTGRKWRAQVRTKGYSGSKTFATREEAAIWAHSVEWDVSRRAVLPASARSAKGSLKGDAGAIKRERSRWRGMMYRCYSPAHAGYEYYGERGIYVCERWHVFEHFYNDMGPAPDGASIDRIDNDGPYSLENCRWATHKQQANNKRMPSREKIDRAYYARVEAKNAEMRKGFFLGALNDPELLAILQKEEDMEAAQQGRAPANIADNITRYLNGQPA